MMTQDGRLSVADRFARNEAAIIATETRVIALERAFWQVRGMLALIALEVPVLVALTVAGVRL